MGVFLGKMKRKVRGFLKIRGEKGKVCGVTLEIEMLFV
jgi:hypothetical protein